MNVRRPGSRLGSSLSMRRKASSPLVVGPSLTPMGVPHAGQEVNVGVVQLAGPLTDPQEVRGRVVGQAGARIDACECALVVEQQCFVAGEELHALECLKVGAAGVHEADGTVDVARQRFVARVCRVLGEPLVPLVNQAEIRETALGEGSDEVQRGCGRVVRLKHPAGVVCA